MWVKHIMLGFLGLTSGLAVAGGTFAFLIAIGVLPRLVGKSNTARSTLAYETAVFLGGVFGNIVSVFLDIPIPFGKPILVLFGFCAGVFVGCLAVSLAEIINTFPIVFRRFKLDVGLAWVLAFMAFGKLSGALYYFWRGYQSTL